MGISQDWRQPATGAGASLERNPKSAKRFSEKLRDKTKD